MTKAQRKKLLADPELRAALKNTDGQDGLAEALKRVRKASTTPQRQRLFAYVEDGMFERTHLVVAAPDRDRAFELLRGRIPAGSGFCLKADSLVEVDLTKESVVIADYDSWDPPRDP